VLTYRLTLSLLRPAATRATLYRADDGSPDLVEIWRMNDGREVACEVIGAGECTRLWRPLPLCTGADLRREIGGGLRR
jgi:hypothetical protein